ncbi:hypothetical protein YC2023_067593 [Brassica napus]
MMSSPIEKKLEFSSSPETDFILRRRGGEQPSISFEEESRQEERKTNFASLRQRVELPSFSPPKSYKDDAWQSRDVSSSDHPSEFSLDGGKCGRMRRRYGERK